MALVRMVSEYVPTFPLGFFEVLQGLRSVGWTVTAAGDGLSAYSDNPATAGTLFTSGNSGANGLGNVRAWFAIQSPDNLNALTFQLGATTGSNVRVKWSPGGVFSTGGTFDRTSPVTGGVEGLVRGGGTDASPTFSFVGSVSMPARFICVASDTAPYTFWWAATRYGVGEVLGGWFLDTVTSTMTGDASPYVLAIQPTTSAFSTSGLNAEVAYWVPSASPSELISSGSAVAFGRGSAGNPGSATAVNSIGPNPFTLSDVVTPVAYSGSQATENPRRLWKGISENIYWCGALRATWDLYTIDTTQDRVLLREMLFPWDGSNVVF